jgi:hypothetical protein
LTIPCLALEFNLLSLANTFNIVSVLVFADNTFQEDSAMLDRPRIRAVDWKLNLYNFEFSLQSKL